MTHFRANFYLVDYFLRLTQAGQKQKVTSVMADAIHWYVYIYIWMTKQHRRMRRLKCALGNRSVEKRGRTRFQTADLARSIFMNTGSTFTDVSNIAVACCIWYEYATNRGAAPNSHLYVLFPVPFPETCHGETAAG